MDAVVSDPQPHDVWEAELLRQQQRDPPEGVELRVNLRRSIKVVMKVPRHVNIRRRQVSQIFVLHHSRYGLPRNAPSCAKWR